MRKSLPAGLQEFISDKDRVGWKYFIESDISGKVLDVGSGWGALAFSFAKNCEAVYALEPVWERVNFIRIRAEQDREGNLFPVCADALNLPFPDNYFDLVIFNGVLEWLGCSDLRLKPDIAQEKGLKEAQRVLRPGGSLYIGIENKLSFFYFLGVKDPHSRLRFATLMPKKIANLYSKLLKKKEYRTYIYSMPGYRELLSKSGFKSVSFFLPAPGYIKFKHIVALDKDRINDIDYFFRLINFRIIFSPALFRIFFVLVKMLFSPFLRNIFKLFVPDYLIIAKK
ncbi:MAG: methyltransferase domain-containing protein [Candidatus Omnitrophica bacterium]|nr:methyltransferase domain-containing protein [Candidatus Omnitrophota bacterium]